MSAGAHVPSAEEVALDAAGEPAVSFAESPGEALSEGLGEGAGLDHAAPYAAGGSDCRVAAAARDARAAAEVPGA
jgi:hypothetical protein